MGIALNDSLSTDFLEQYYDKFYEDNVHLQLNKNIKVTKEFMKSDTCHVKFDKELIYKEVKYTPFSFLKCSKLTSEQFEKVKHLLSEQDVQLYKDNYLRNKEEQEPVLSTEYLDNLLDKENWYEDICRILKNLNKEDRNFLKNYKNIEKLIKKLIDVNSHHVFNLTLYVPAQIIEKYPDARWNFEWISREEEIPISTLRNLQEKLNWPQITVQKRIAEDIILNNLDLPWKLDYLI